MPPSLAALLTAGFVLFLFVRDFRTEKKVNVALWVPVLWLFITCSRFVSQWIDLGGPVIIDDGSEGSPIDAVYFGSLILAGATVLMRRRIAVANLVRNNLWLTAFIVYALLSVVWSDFPFISFKRWIKWFGQPVMALIILTDPNPTNALRTVLKRCSYVLIPASILLIKYFPQYGRGFDGWTGEAFNNGVGLNKNYLGFICMIFGLFFVWNLIGARRIDSRRAARQEVILSVGFLCMIGWLLTMSDSKTSLVAFVLGTATMLVFGLRVVNRRYIGVYIMVAVLVAIVAEVAFDVYANVIELLGRDPTLTDRTVIWREILALQDRPILGFGFESFWLDPRLPSLWAKGLFPPLTQAHNGYIETYLNLGSIGVFLLVALIISTYHKISRQLLTDLEFARFRLAFLFAVVFYNNSEATLTGLHPVWTMFLIIAIDYPSRRLSKTQRRQTTRLGPLPQHASLQDHPRHVMVDSGVPRGASREQSVREGGGYDS